MGVSWNPDTNTVTLEDGTAMHYDEWVNRERPVAKVDSTEWEELRTFFFGAPTPDPAFEWARGWKEEGRCPRCGELGRIHLSTFICSTHGVY